MLLKENFKKGMTIYWFCTGRQWRSPAKYWRPSVHKSWVERLEDDKYYIVTSDHRDWRITAEFLYENEVDAKAARLIYCDLRNRCLDCGLERSTGGCSKTECNYKNDSMFK